MGLLERLNTNLSSGGAVMPNSATSWIVAYQAPLSMEFFRQKYGTRLPFPTPGDLANPGIEPMPLHLLH